jgi:Tryptophan-rich sensory protein (mitochondrial benzodiazepine receptor homolog)
MFGLIFHILLLMRISGSKTIKIFIKNSRRCRKKGGALMSETGKKGNSAKFAGASAGAFAGALAVTAAAGGAAALFTANAEAVCGALTLPAFAPPAALLAPVLIALHLLMGVSLFLAVRHGMRTPGVKSAVSYFALQLVFNVLWSPLFFALGLRVAALADMIILFFYILITIVKFHRVDKAAAYLLIPYLIWTAYAAALNLAVVLLNG